MPTLEETAATIECFRADGPDEPSGYAIRIGAPDAALVEVSIDNGPWEPCRHERGYWWPEAAEAWSGRHHVRAQLFHADGRLLGVVSRRLGAFRGAA